MSAIGHAPLFQVIFIFHNEKTPILEFSGLILESLNINAKKEKFDLRLYIEDTGQVLKGAFRFKTDLFDAATIHRMSKHFRILLEGVVSNPYQRLSDLPCLTESEQQQLIIKRNSNQAKSLKKGDLSHSSPDQTKQKSGKTFCAPQNKLELKLTKIWEKVLKVKPIGIYDNFFDLGGHSLLAVRLFTEIEKKSGKILPLSTLFQAPTIEQLAQIFTNKYWTLSRSQKTQIRTIDSKPLFFSVSAHGNVITYYDISSLYDSHQPDYELRAVEMKMQLKRDTSVEEIASNYVTEIRTRQPEGPYFLYSRHCSRAMALEVAQQLQKQNQAVALIAIIDGGFPPRTRNRTNHYMQRALIYLKHFRLHTVLRSFLRIIGKKIKNNIKNISNEKKSRPDPSHFDYSLSHDKYIGKRYSGKIFLFFSSEAYYSNRAKSVLSAWSKYAVDEFDYYIFPNCKKHTLMQKQNFQIILEKLMPYFKTALTKGQKK